MRHETDPDGTIEADGGEHLADRRRALKIGAGIAAGAWIAPAVLSLDAAAAQSGPSGGNGSISGVVQCGQTPQNNAQVELVDISNNVIDTTTSSPPTGAFAFANVTAGSYVVRIRFTGSQTAVSVTGGSNSNTTIFFCS